MEDFKVLDQQIASLLQSVDVDLMAEKTSLVWPIEKNKKMYFKQSLAQSGLHLATNPYLWKEDNNTWLGTTGTVLKKANPFNKSNKTTLVSKTKFQF